MNGGQRVYAEDGKEGVREDWEDRGGSVKGGEKKLEEGVCREEEEHMSVRGGKDRIGESR